MKTKHLLFALVASSAVIGIADAQQISNGRVTTSAPTYTSGNTAPISLDTSGNQRTQTQGSIPSGSTDSGNPVKIGGVYNATQPTFTTGQRGDIQIGTRGSMSVQLMNQDSATALATQNTSADAIATSASNIQLRVAAPAYVFNGTTWDRLRGDTSGITLGTGTNNIGVTGVAQGSTTSGQRGDLTQAAVSTAAPSYTNGQTSPLSLTTAGALRTRDDTDVAQGSTTSGQVGLLVQGAVTTSAPAYTTAQTSPLSLTTSGQLRTLVDVNPVQTTSATGSLSTTATVFKASAGTLYGINFRSGSIAATVQIFDNASACSGTVRAAFVTDTNTNGSMDFVVPISFTTGITACTTGGTIAVAYTIQ